MSFGKKTIGRKEREGERERREFIGETNDISTVPTVCMLVGYGFHPGPAKERLLLTYQLL